ncbi:hypothetical protein MRX96_035463 [Rhipicephalus microplus]
MACKRYRFPTYHLPDGSAKVQWLCFGPLLASCQAAGADDRPQAAPEATFDAVTIESIVRTPWTTFCAVSTVVVIPPRMATPAGTRVASVAAGRDSLPLEAEPCMPRRAKIGGSTATALAGGHRSRLPHERGETR